ncbi:efflux RND transporter periplasmic adaptor subunit [Tropicimonas sp. IMCC6043]|uniref:efflux RND transporter periplasmic adaptor subunit n=1 Tax=Tropicimonas sp. IMCC6043 TaxID=2510645 RepID=UPI00101D4727|nr:HlyD family efflux transporter periplasmic adaptor subunit [Tropicimonas sp. IMCC6043]RYH11117.1 HlyD family efflux transporter periplasmic adaptor subunit [Tropicimonas sp. IMCC6043]
MAGKKRTRRILTFLLLALVLAGLGWAFRPQPVLVDIGEVTQGPMLVTIDEEARTRVHEPYVVSTPVTGRLLRVEVEPGDVVTRGVTVVAHMLPTNPSALDIRTREQARAAVTAAEAALRVARADLNKAMADNDLAQSDLERAKRLTESGTLSEASLERAEATARAAQATLDTAGAAIAMREAEVDTARAQLIGFDDQGLAAALQISSEHATPLFAPATGRILQVMQKSETTLAVGTPIMEIGNIEDDLEVVVELLSTDAVQVELGDPVIIDKWGGAVPLNGKVIRIDPWGFTKYSALGVEEQRVNARIAFTDPPETRAALGHGYRVEVRIVVWEKPDAVIVPASALFRSNGGHAVFVVGEDGMVALRPVELERSNGLEASVASGLVPGERIVLYPAPGLAEGTKVAQRQAS